MDVLREGLELSIPSPCHNIAYARPILFRRIRSGCLASLVPTGKESVSGGLWVSLSCTFPVIALRTAYHPSVAVNAVTHSNCPLNRQLRALRNLSPCTLMIAVSPG